MPVKAQKPFQKNASQIGKVADKLQPEAPINLSDAYAIKTPEDSRRLYAAWADNYDQTFIAANNYIYPQRVADIFADLIPALPDMQIIDIGCGTGAVGNCLAGLRPELIIDGYDISPEMLAQATRLRRVDDSSVYRNLCEVDLTRNLPSKIYDAMTSAGTFTHGHLGPETFLRLFELVARGGWFVVGINSEHYQARGFAEVIQTAVASEVISKPVIHEVDVYAPGSPHHGDRAKVCIFQRFK